MATIEVNEALVRKVADLARLALTDEEVRLYDSPDHRHSIAVVGATAEKYRIDERCRNRTLNGAGAVSVEPGSQVFLELWYRTPRPRSALLRHALRGGGRRHRYCEEL